MADGTPMDRAGSAPGAAPDPFPDFTPVNLLTGFLGSGKTTLLARLLADPALARTAVLINEFGDVGLDHHLVDRIDDAVVLLASGCVCCTIRGDLAAAIRDLLGRRARGAVPAFDRIVVESSGLADPFPILSTLKADPVLRHHVRAGIVVATVDAVNGLATLDAHGASARQAAIADRLVITKTDLADADRTAALAARLARINPDAAVHDAGDPGLDARALLGLDGAGEPRVSPGAWFADRFRSDGADAADADAADDAAAAGHLARIRSIEILLDDPIDWSAFGLWLTMLLNRHGDRVLRVKGILSLIGEDRPIAIHGVQHLVHPPQHLPGWPSHDHRSRLVFILDDLDPALVRRSLEAFAGVGACADG